MVQLVLFPEDRYTTVVSIKKGTLVHEFPEPLWAMAIATFDSHYKPGVNAKELAFAVAHDLAPTIYWDPFRERRLATCLLSVKGRNGAKKANANRAMRKAQASVHHS